MGVSDPVLTLEDRIEAKIGALLDALDEVDGEGKPRLTAAQQLTALTLALKWVAFQRKIDEGDGGYGSDL